MITEKTSIRNCKILYYLICAVLVCIGIIKQDQGIYFAGLCALVGSTLVFYSEKTFYTCIILFYFIFDQILIDAGGSTLKAYTILSLMIVLLSGRTLIHEIRTTGIAQLTFWLGICAVLCLVSGNALTSLRTFMGVIVQALMAYAIYVLLIKERISPAELDRTLILTMWIYLIFAIIQFFAYQTFGIALGFDTKTTMEQLRIGQIPSFRVEANAYGKLLGWSIIYLIPSLTHRESHIRRHIPLLVITSAVFLISVTRHALYAMLITLCFMLIVSIINGRAGRYICIIIAGSVMIGILLLLISKGIIRLGEYSGYKLNNLFFNIGNVRRDGSALYRVESMIQAINIWKSSPLKILIGAGFGNVIGDLRSVGGNIQQVGGGDIVTVLSSFGIVGFISYLSIYGSIIRKNIRYAGDPVEITIWKERIVFLLVYSFSMGFFSGYMLYPEFWMLFGIGAYLSKPQKETGITELREE